MREILFKANRIDNGEWVEGNLIQSTYFGEVIAWQPLLPEYEPKGD